MCGIVGLIHKSEFGFWQAHGSLFGNMLYMDTIRGEDSTGVFGVTKNGNVSILKSALPGYEFVNLKEFDKFKEAMNRNYIMVVGHNRAATRGEIKPENAHPFKEGHITLVHNGTIWDQDKKEFEVDSHALCAEMAEKGEKEALRNIKGAYALVWYNKQTKRLNLARNSQRPLHLIEAGEIWIISSEPGLPMWLMMRQGNGFHSDPKINRVMEVATDCIVSFDVESKRRDKFRYTSLKEEFHAPVVILPPDAPKREIPSLLHPKADAENDAVVDVHHSETTRLARERLMQGGGDNIVDITARPLKLKDGVTTPNDIVEFVKEYKEFKSGRTVILHPYDWKVADGKFVGPNFNTIICGVMDIAGKHMDKIVAHITVHKDLTKDYVDRKDIEFFSGRIKTIQLIKDAATRALKMVVFGMDLERRPQPEIFGTTANSFFVNEGDFKSWTPTGCRHCQTQLAWANISKYIGVKENDKYRFYCEATKCKDIAMQGFSSIHAGKAVG